MLLGRRHERLHQVDVALAAVGLELDLQAVVAETLDLDRGRSDVQGLADRSGQLTVGTAAEDDDFAHDLASRVWCPGSRLTLPPAPEGVSRL